jgi:glyoxylase-like metal-dependent hydrolase (beta-lactamase superfamily II)
MYEIYALKYAHHPRRASENFKRGRQHLRCPTEALRLMGVSASEVKDVIITHLHYDHVGNFDLFPAATLHVQDLEMRYATGRPLSAAIRRDCKATAGCASWPSRRSTSSPATIPW